jgi:hypothetical protein
MGSSIADVFTQKETLPATQAFDAKTGAKLWSFHTIPATKASMDTDLAGGLAETGKHERLDGDVRMIVNSTTSTS